MLPRAASPPGFTVVVVRHRELLVRPEPLLFIERERREYIPEKPADGSEVLPRSEPIDDLLCLLERDVSVLSDDDFDEFPVCPPWHYIPSLDHA